MDTREDIDIAAALAHEDAAAAAVDAIVDALAQFPVGERAALVARALRRLYPHMGPAGTVASRALAIGAAVAVGVVAVEERQSAAAAPPAKPAAQPKAGTTTPDADAPVDDDLEDVAAAFQAQTHKDKIEAFLVEHPGATVGDIAIKMYGDDSRRSCNRTRALLHAMTERGRTRSVADGRHVQWYVVPPEGRLAARATALAKTLRGGGAV